MSEFEEWLAFFDERLEYPEKSDYYTAATIRAIYASQGGKVGPIKDFMLKFEPPKPDVQQDSESVWLGIFGIEKEA